MPSTRRPDPVNASLSRRQVLRRLGWGSGAIGMLGAGPMPDFGELRLPGLTSPVPAEGTIKLSSNENPYGMCPAASQRLQDELPNANRYPFAWSAELQTAIAARHGVSDRQIVLGAGSTEILRMCAAAWGERGILQAEPTFETLGSYARGAGHTVVAVPLDEDGRHDLAAMQGRLAEAGVVYVCNPSNPAGTLLPQADFDAFLDAVPSDKLVLVDEAYHEFVLDDAYRSQIDRAVNSPNIVAIRTFSKVYGMAGMRIGYAIGSRQRIRELDRFRTEMSVGVISAACAASSLQDDEYPRQQQRLNAEARAVLERGLGRLGLPFWHSETNFVMCDLGRPMMPVNRAMAERGVLVGRLFPAVPQRLRISIGTPAQMQRCVETLSAVLV